MGERFAATPRNAGTCLQLDQPVSAANCRVGDHECLAYLRFAATHASAEVFSSDAIVSILLAAASTEAFITELSEMLALHPRSPELRACVDALAEVEEAQGSLNLKYQIASQILSGTMFNKGANPFQDFAILVRLRNDLMHLKPQDTFVDGPKEFTIQVPKYIVALHQRGLAHTPAPELGMSWFQRLQTAEMATWACETARLIIVAVLDLIADDPNQARDPTLMFKRIFRQ